jgi:tetratricopeptide (TPR) repeat protein
MLTPVLSKPEQKKPFVADGKNTNVQQLPNFKDHGMSFFATDFKESLDFLAARRAKIVRQLNPAQNARAVVELGDIHLAKKELRPAEKAYRDAIRKDSHLIDAYKKLIPLLVGRGDLRLADVYFKRFVEATNNHLDATHEYLLFRLALFVDQPGELNSIQLRLKELIKASPDKLELRNTLGITILIHESNAARAESIFQKVLDEDPNNVDALNNIGICFQRQKHFDKAYRFYKKALAVKSDYSPAYENIASNFVSQNKLNEALDALLEGRKAGLRYTPNWDHNTGWLMLLTGRLADAKQWYLDKVKEEPGNNLLFNNLGVCYENLGDITLAKENYQKAVELTLSIKKQINQYNDPRALNGFYNLCRLLQREGDFSMQEAVAKHFVNFDSDNPAALYYLGSARIPLKKSLSARKLLEQSIALRNDVAAPYIDLGFLLECILHEYSEAVTILESALNKGLNDEYIVNNLAYAYTKNDQVNEAEKLLSFKEKYPNTTATRGLIEFYKGNFAAGNKFYKKALGGITESKKDEARQIWNYEQAAFWYRNEDYDKAKDYLERAEALGKEGYIYADISKLKSDIRSKRKTLRSA